MDDDGEVRSHAQGKAGYERIGVNDMVAFTDRT